MPRRTTKGFNAQAFYADLARTVDARRVTWRQVARETGVAPSTLTRMAKGCWPDGASLAVLSAWANLNPANYVENCLKATTSPKTLAEISALIKADSQLVSDDAIALQSAVQVVYKGLQGQNKGH